MRAGFPHSDICGSAPICRLPAAFRRLSRPSSPIIAKASTTCTYSLDPITLLPLARRSRPKSPQPSHDHRKLSRLCIPTRLTWRHDAIHYPVSTLPGTSSQDPSREDNYLHSRLLKSSRSVFLHRRSTRQHRARCCLLFPLRACWWSQPGSNR